MSSKPAKCDGARNVPNVIRVKPLIVEVRVTYVLLVIGLRQIDCDIYHYSSLAFGPILFYNFFSSSQAFKKCKLINQFSCSLFV